MSRPSVNYIGGVVPTEEQVEQLLAAIATVTESLSTWGTVLTTEQRTRFLKPRIGSDGPMEIVASLAADRGLSLKDVPLEQMAADLQIAKRAERLERAIQFAHRNLSDTRFAAFAEAWKAFLGYYAVLSSMAAHDPDLASRLRPVSEFMATRSRGRRAEG